MNALGQLLAGIILDGCSCGVISVEYLITNVLREAGVYVCVCAVM